MQAAARTLRREGYANTGVAEVMREAGLTHGGFYAHFPSREALLAEGFDHAAGEAIESLLGAAAVQAATEAVDPFEAIVDSYLSDRHVAATETGCTLAALGSETRRQSPAIRRVATRRVKELVAALGTTIGPAAPEPLAALSALVGALVISRVVDDPALSREVRAATRRLVLAAPRRSPSR